MYWSRLNCAMLWVAAGVFVVLRGLLVVLDFVSVSFSFCVLFGGSLT
jgi:hypothetical protein